MQIIIIDIHAAPEKEALWRMEALGSLPVPAVNEDIQINGKWYTVVERKWIANGFSMHILVYAKFKPEL